jgi:hypothetical protein
MLEILKEVTVWNTDNTVANHTYLLDGNKLIAYAKFGTDEIIVSKTQFNIDKRYRKFIRDNHSGLSKLIKKQKTDPNTRVFKVQSGEKEYFVTNKSEKYTCTCTGFNFRGKCKHIDAVVNKLQA